MNPIDKFLSDPKRNYDEGVALLKARFSNKNIIRMLEEKRRPAEHRWMVLEYQLGKFSETKSAPVPLAERDAPMMKAFDPTKKATAQKETAPASETDTKGIRPKYVNNEFVDVASLPEKYQAKYKRITEIYQESEQAHEAMKKAKTDEERQKLAQSLVELEDKQLDLWKELDEYSISQGNAKTEKAPSQAPKFDIVVAVKRLKVLKDNISKYKKALKEMEAGTSAYKRKQKSIDKFNEEFKELNAAIEAHK